jgi:hypothetical protein
MTVMVLSQLDEARGGPQASGLASYPDPSSLNGFAIRRITLLATSPQTSFQLSSERGRRFLLTQHCLAVRRPAFFFSCFLWTDKSV